MKRLKECIGWCNEVGIDFITSWLLSRENLSRPQKELEPYFQVLNELFEELFIKSLTTIEVTAEQNTKLRTLTKHRNGIFKIKQPTYNKYNYLNIELYKKEPDETWDKSVPTDNILDVPEELTLYEQKFLVS